MPLIHGEQEEGQHHQNHAEGGRTGINGISEQKEKRHSYKYRCPKTDKLPACQAEQHFGFDLGKVFGNCYIRNNCHLREKEKRLPVWKDVFEKIQLCSFSSRLKRLG